MFLDRCKCRGKSIKITSFWDQFSTILFPFKYKFLPFLETKRALVVREFFLSFSFWGCLLSKKISSKFLKKIFLNGFSKKKWVDSLNTHLSFFWVWVKTQFFSWWSFKEKAKIKFGKDSKYVPKDEGMVERCEGACQVVREGLEILS